MAKTLPKSAEAQALDIAAILKILEKFPALIALVMQIVALFQQRQPALKSALKSEHCPACVHEECQAAIDCQVKALAHMVACCCCEDEPTPAKP